MKKAHILSSAALLAMLAPLSAQAFDLGQISINGFVSQGYLDTNKNNLFTTQSHNGTFQLNEVGITVNAPITDQLKVGAQILSRDLGMEGNNDIKLDWAYGDYRIRDWFGVRLGKVKMPMGLYNEGRDTDSLRNMVFLPQSIYDETKRDLLVAYQGIGLYGNIPAKAAGDFDYHVFYGTINFDDDSIFMTGQEMSALGTIKQGVMTPLFVSKFPGATPLEKQAAAKKYVQGLAVSDFEIENNYIFGGSLIWNTPVSGLKTGISYLRVSNDISVTMNKSTDPNTVTDPYLSTIGSSYSGELENEGTWVGSAEYAIGPVTLSGEYSETTRSQSYGDYYAAKDSTSQSYYGMASYAVTDKITASVLYDVYYADKDDRDGSSFVAGAPAGARKDFMAWRKDLGVAARYDVNANMCIKAEYHYVDGTALLMNTVNEVSDMERYWNYVALKATFTF